MAFLMSLAYALFGALLCTFILTKTAYDEPSKNDGFDEIQFCFDDDIDMPPFN